MSARRIGLSPFTGSLFVAVLFAGGCARDSETASVVPRTARVERRDVIRECREDGVLMATRAVDLYPPCAEPLVEVPAAEGARVKKGAVLARFDTARFDREIRVLEARVEAARLRLASLQRQREKGESLEARRRVIELNQAVEESRRAFRIQEELARLGLAPTGETRKASARLESAELEAALAQAQADEIAAHPKSPEMAELEASLAEAERQLDEAQENRRNCTVTAPFDGMVMTISEVVKNANAPLADLAVRLSPQGAPVVTIADVATVRAVASFFESDVADLRVGQQAAVTASHVPGREFKGRVSEMSQMGDVRGRTSTLRVGVEVRNDDVLLRPGLTAQVRIVVSERKNVLSLPGEFVHVTDEAPFVWVVGAGGARRRVAVTTGLSDGRHVEIQSGLAEHDTVRMEE
jgi:RND family efflux transporter MFP subunit